MHTFYMLIFKSLMKIKHQICKKGEYLLGNSYIFQSYFI